MKPISTFFRIAGNAVCGAVVTTVAGVGVLAAMHGKQEAVDAVKASLTALQAIHGPHALAASELIMTGKNMVVIGCVAGGAAVGATRGVIRSIWPAPKKEKKLPSTTGIVLRSVTLTTIMTLGAPLVGGALLIAADQPSSVALKKLPVLLGIGGAAGLGLGAAWATGEARVRRRMLAAKKMQTPQAAAPQ